jgi:UDP-glucose 4-epimerase
MRRVLITGGAGFIGSHLCEACLRRGDEVVVLDNLTTGSLDNLEHLEVDFTRGDIRDRDAVDAVMTGVSHVFHQAAFVSVAASMESPVECYDVNLLGTLNVLDSARANGVRTVVLASSAAVYGESDVPVDESRVSEPLSPYAASKLAMEAAARLYASAYRLPTLCLRYFNVYGPRQSPHSHYAAAIPLFIRAMISGERATIHGDGGQSRDFVYIDDVVHANLKAINADTAAGEAYNIAAGRVTTINDLVENLQRIIPDAPSPSHGPPREGDIYYSAADIRRAEAALGYHPKTALRDGLQATVQWFERKESQNTA